MGPMNDTDARKLAASFRAWADMVETSLVPALQIAHGWKGATKAATYDPTGRSGHRHDVYEENGLEVVVAVPHDPTGEAAFNPPDRNRHSRIVAAMGQAEYAGLTLERLVKATVPTSLKPSRAELADDEGWCTSCYRIGMWTPEHTHADGRVKHRALCSWCASFKAENGVTPPEGLLRKRRDGKKITEADVAEALGRRRAS